MANSSYLVCCDFPETCAAVRWPAFNPAAHILAAQSYAVPLLWLAAFRPADLRQSSIALQDGGTWTDLSPITTATQGLRQLEQTLPALNRLFANHGSFERYVAMFNRLLSNLPGAYLSIQLSEIAALSDPTRFARMLIKALNALQQPLGSAPIGQWDQDLRTIVPQTPDLRGKRAVDFLVAQTGEKKAVVERVLKNCRGELGKALGFFHWQAALSKEADALAEESGWACLAELSGLRLHRPFPDATLTHFANEDDAWNHCRLLGSSYLRPVPWE